MDKSTLGGIVVALTGVGIGLALDGGKVGQMLQPTAALIVFGGTLGAVMVEFPLPVIRQAARQLRDVFAGVEEPTARIIEDLTRYAARARRDGLLSLDAELELVGDAFLKRSLSLAIDGMRPAELRQMMELEMDIEAEKEDLIPRVFEAAGGYAPTVGILGAVIGLIQVMQRLGNINEVGRGIAVAFVATIYGVGSANIFFLPCAGRIKMLMRRKQVLRELMLDGVISIMDGAGPKAIEHKLSGYLARSSEAFKEKLAVR